MRKDKHIESVRNTLAPRSNYYVYNGNIEHLQAHLAESVKRFERSLWTYLSQDVDIDPVAPFPEPPYLEIQYGELYIVMGKGRDRFQLKLELIEAY